MNKVKTLVPKLRFPEFRESENWKQTPLEDCLDYQQPTPYLVSDSKYSPAFKTPVLTAGKTFILGYTDEQHGIFSEGLPVIIFDDFTTATQFVDFPFKAKSSAMKILQAKNGADIKFMYETLQTISYEVGVHGRHWISNFTPMLVPVPKPAEQQKIAECLSSVDELVAAQAQKVDTLKTHKKGLMQQLFPREGETQPRLRFYEFQNAGEWKGEKLGVIGEPLMCKRILKEQTNTIHGIPFYKIGTFGKMADSFISTDLYNEYSNKYSFPKTGEILISAAGTIGRLVVYDGAPAFFQDSNIVWLENNEELVLNKFLFHCYSTIEWQTSDGGIISRLYNSDLRNIKILFPAGKDEQIKIADCLYNIDELIATHTNKLEALKTHKKGLMQQLFPSPAKAEA